MIQGPGGGIFPLSRVNLQILIKVLSIFTKKRKPPPCSPPPGRGQQSVQSNTRETLWLELNNSSALAAPATTLYSSLHVTIANWPMVPSDHGCRDQVDSVQIHTHRGGNGGDPPPQDPSIHQTNKIQYKKVEQISSPGLTPTRQRKSRLLLVALRPLPTSLTPSLPPPPLLLSSLALALHPSLNLLRPVSFSPLYCGGLLPRPMLKLLSWIGSGK